MKPARCATNMAHSECHVASQVSYILSLHSASQECNSGTAKATADKDACVHDDSRDADLVALAIVLRQQTIATGT